jgi:ferredoxin
MESISKSKIIYKSEYVCSINIDKCEGCRSCMKFCQFGVINYSPFLEKCAMDARKCYGCGICRQACPNNAISLEERNPILGW